MTIQLLLFAAHRELAGRSRLTLEVPWGATPDDVFRMLATETPDLQALRSSTSFAINREMVAASVPLAPGDELAFLQPVSGG